MKLPKHTYVYRRKARKGTRCDFYFVVKEDYRPDDWPSTIRLPLDSGKRTRDGSPDEVAAVIRDANELNVKLSACTVGAHKRGTMPWLYERWLADRAGLKPKTLQFYNLGWSKIQARLGSKAVGDLKWPEIYRFIREFDDTPASQRAVKKMLKQLFQIARNEGIIEQSPFAAEEPTLTPRRRPQISEIKILDYGQVMRLVAICDEAGRPSVGTAVMVGFELMQYPSHTIAFRRGKDYEPSTGMFSFERNKTGEPIITPVSETLRRRLAGVDLYLIISEVTRRPYSKRALSSALKTIIAGIEDEAERKTYTGFRLGWLRHSGVFESYRAGLTKEQIADVGGWKTTGSIQQILDRHYRVRDPQNAIDGQRKRAEFRESTKRS